MSEFKSASTDVAALRKRMTELFGEPELGTEPGTENGVDTRTPEAPPKSEPGHYDYGF
jgi:hypothetical protein